MKKFIVAVMLSTVALSGVAFAQTSTSTPSAAPGSVVSAAEQQIQVLRKQMESEIKAIREKYQAQIDALRKTAKDDAAKLRDQRKKDADQRKKDAEDKRNKEKNRRKGAGANATSTASSTLPR